MRDLIVLKDLLQTDRLVYSSHLKMIEEYGHRIDCRLRRQDEAWEAALLIPVACSSFDAELYPDAAYIVYLAGAGGRITTAILNEIPKGMDLVFKLHAPEYRIMVESKFQLEWIRALLSYTCPDGLSLRDCPEVVRSSCLDEGLLPLWLKNGYCRKDIEKYFVNGASSFSIYINGEPVSTCLIFHNCLDIWEVGAVHTLESERGKGYARKVVSAALNAVLAAGNIPKYQVVHSNLPSIRLADSLGLELFLKLDHWYCKEHTHKMKRPIR